MFQPIKIQKCTQLKTGRFITVVQTVNLYFTKLLYTVRFGETKTGESRNENLLLAKGCFQVKLKYLWCSVAVLTTDVAPGMVHTVALLLNLAEAHMLHRGFWLLLIPSVVPFSTSVRPTFSTILGGFLLYLVRASTVPQESRLQLWWSSDFSNGKFARKPQCMAKSLWSKGERSSASLYAFF